jgi:hypothetical protein
LHDAPKCAGITGSAVVMDNHDFNAMLAQVLPVVLTIVRGCAWLTRLRPARAARQTIPGHRHGERQLVADRPVRH